MATLICVRPIMMFDAKIVFRVSKPAMPAMSCVATLPVISLVMAMLRPCSIRKVPSVTRKLGSLVRIMSQPLNAPTQSEKNRAKTTPAHRLPATSVAKIEAARDDVVTATPADRSNSPPIISIENRDSRDADGRGLVEDGRERRELPEWRGHHPEEHEDQDRSAERAGFGASQSLSPEGLSLVLAPRSRQDCGFGGLRHDLLPLAHSAGGFLRSDCPCLAGRSRRSGPVLSACRP